MNAQKKEIRAKAPLTIRPDLASGLKPKSTGVRVVHDGEDSDDKEKNSVENEVSIHRLCGERIPPRISSPWTSSSVVGREQLIRIELTFACGLVKKAFPRLNATFFKQRGLVCRFDVDAWGELRPKAKNHPPGSRRSFRPENTFRSIPWRVSRR